MDWASYKRLCDRPDVWSRWMLEQTEELLEGKLAAVIATATADRPVAKPAGHKGGGASDMFVLRLPVSVRRDITQAVARARDAGRTTSGTRRRGLGGFVEAWQEYAQWKGDHEQS